MLKSQLVSKAKERRANAVMNFEYGQKSLNALRAITRLFDADVEWYAKGTAVILDEVTYADLVRRLARSEDED